MRQTSMYGWSELCRVDGRDVWLVVKRGRFAGKRYGNNTYIWNAQVIQEGKVAWSGSVPKGVTKKHLLSKFAGTLST
jgi:hypothetical protein